MALAVVNSTYALANGVSSAETPSISTTSGNLIVAEAAWYTGAGVFSSIGDSVPNTWTGDSVATIVCGGNCEAKQRYLENCTGDGSHTFTLTLTTTGYASLAVKQISGALTASSLAETDISEITYSPWTLPLTTSAQNDEILCAFAAAQSGAIGAITQTGSFTQDQSLGVFNEVQALLSSHLIVSATGTQDPFSFTNAGYTETFGLGVRAFKAATAAVLEQTHYRFRADDGTLGAP